MVNLPLDDETRRLIFSEERNVEEVAVKVSENLQQTWSRVTQSVGLTQLDTKCLIIRYHWI